MKKILITICAFFIVGFAHADTLNMNWMVGDSVYDTSTCTIGGDIILPTAPTKRGYTFMGWSFFTPIEYLESTGTQYIDTDFYPDYYSSLIIDFKSSRAERGIIAYIKSYIGIFQDTSDTSVAFVVRRGNNGSQDVVFFLASSIYDGGTGRYLVDINPKNISITASDNSVVSFASKNTAFKSPYSLYLFGSNNNNVLQQNLSHIQIYSTKLYDNDVLVRDFIPVLDHDGVPCMYDRVSGTFFYNSGTGDFIAGPVIAE